MADLAKWLKVVAGRWRRAGLRVFRVWSSLRSGAQRAVAVIVALSFLIGIVWPSHLRDSLTAWFHAGLTRQALAVVAVGFILAVWALYQVEREADDGAKQFVLRFLDGTRERPANSAKLRRYVSSKDVREWDDRVEVHLELTLWNLGEHEEAMRFPYVSCVAAYDGKARQVLEVIRSNPEGWTRIGDTDQRRGYQLIPVRRETPYQLSFACLTKNPYALIESRVQVTISIEIVGKAKPLTSEITINPPIPFEMLTDFRLTVPPLADPPDSRAS